jgi:hypothetical protein
MKLPVIKHIHRHASAEQINTTLEVLEQLSEAPLMKDEDLDVIGELISNLCGALEVHQLVAEGMAEKDACNNFMKKVISSIDK